MRKEDFLLKLRLNMTLRKTLKSIPIEFFLIFGILRF